MNVKTMRILLFTLLCFVLVACSSGNENDNRKESTDNSSAAGKKIGKELKVAIPAAPPGLDSHISTAQVIVDVGRPVFENLVTVDSNFTVQPMLAESWEQSDDRKTLTFHLRKGVSFHNGKEMKAEDIIASLERWFRLSSLGKADFEGAVLKAEDDYTVVIELPEPVSTALTTLAYGGGNYASIMPKEIVEGAPDDGVKEYIGTGPFKFVEFVQDQYIYLEKFDDYQSLDTPTDGLAGKKEALVEGVRFMLVPDSSTRIAGIQTGEYDVILDVNYDTYDQLNANPDLKTFIDPYGELNIFYNKSKGVFTDVRAREAVALLIDKPDILQAALSNDKFYTLDHSMMMEYQSVLWSSDAGKDEYHSEKDTEKAKQLLKDAGYNGEEVTIITSKEQEYMYNSSIVLQEQLENAGVKVNLEVYDWPTYLDKRSDKDGFDLLVGVSTPKLDPTSMAFLRDDFVGWTESEELEGIIEEFKMAPSIDDAKVVYNDLQEWFYEYRPVMKIGDFSKVNAARNNIEGFDYFDGPIMWNVSNSD